MGTHLLVEHPVALVDVRDVALVLVEPLPRELVPLVLPTRTPGSQSQQDPFSG